MERSAAYPNDSAARPYLSLAGSIAAAFALAVSLLVLAAAPAKADYKFCNATSYVLKSAIAYQSDGVWKSQGWHQILPGNCAPVLRGDITEEMYYVFARSIAAHKGGTKYFSGNERFCTVPGDFLIEGRETCVARGYDAHHFTKVDTKPGKDWTTTFSEPRDYSIKQAKIAGIQRLLIDNEYKLSRVDGYDGRNTTRAIMSFQRSINVKLSDEELAKRRAAMEAKGADAWKPAEERPRKVSQALRAYAAMVSNAARGAVRDVSQIERN